MTIQSHSYDMGLFWLKAAWAVVKNKYFQTLLASFALTGLQLAVLFGVWKGEHLLPIVHGLMIPGILLMAKKWSQGEDAVLDDFFAALHDTDFLKRLAPLIGIEIIFTFFGHVPGMIFSLVAYLVFAFSVPLMFFRKMTLKQTIQLNWMAIQKNWRALLVLHVGLLALLVVAGLALVLPVFLVVLPMSVCLQYLVYGAIFDGFEIKHLIKG